MKTVYVAGAMQADNILDVLNNIHKGINVAGKVAQAGYAPFVPHFDIEFAKQGIKLPMNFYYDYTMEFLKRCDYVVVVDGYENSKGVLEELQKANELKIPVFYNITDLINYDWFEVQNENSL